MTHGPMFAVVMGGLMLIAGMAVGITAFDDNTDPEEVTATLDDEMYHDNGTLNVSEEPPEQSVPGAVPPELNEPVVETPGANAWIRQHIAAPMIRGMLWVAGVGIRLGYGLASVVGVGAAIGVVYAGLAACVGVPAWRGYTLVREVRR